MQITKAQAESIAKLDGYGTPIIREVDFGIIAVYVDRRSAALFTRKGEKIDYHR